MPIVHRMIYIDYFLSQQDNFAWLGLRKGGYCIFVGDLVYWWFVEEWVFGLFLGEARVNNLFSFNRVV